MSYILDALRKAERERGLARVPTLTTVHEPRPTAARRRLWLVSAACVGCAVVIMLMVFYFMKSSERPTRDVDAITEKVSPPEPAGPPEAVAPSESSTVTGPLSTAISPEPLPEVARETHNPVRQIPEKPRAAAAVKEREQPDQIQSVPATAPEPPSAPPSREAPASLHEAMAKMNMTILITAEVPSDRMVFINDRKYVEGDHVEGHYLLESITPEGAVLSYQGERAILRPRSK